MKLAVGFLCLILILAGVFDLEPFRVVRRGGRVQPMRRRQSAERRVARR